MEVEIEALADIGPVAVLLELCLGVPAPVELAIQLRDLGMDIPQDILTTDELVNSLTRSCLSENQNNREL
jgi:hypothetical protein